MNLEINNLNNNNMTTKFIQPVSMRVTQEQYLRDLREPLLAMGYREILITSFIENPILVNNYLEKDGTITNLAAYNAKIFNRHFIPDYNPEYFLAVAAMTSEKFGIIGERWKCIKDVVMRPSNRIAYYKDKLYKSELENCITDEHDKKYHRWRRDDEVFTFFTKATLSDLINHFEPKTNKNTNNMELTEKEKEVLAKLVNKDNEAIFEKIGVRRDKNLIKKMYFHEQAMEELSKYISIANETAVKIGRQDLAHRAFVLGMVYRAKYKFILHEKDGVQVLEITEK